MKVADILRSKGSNVETVQPTDNVATAVQKLADAGIGALVVSSDSETVDGILSERDVVRALPNSGELTATPVAELMTATVTTCTPDQSVDDLIAMMTTGRIRHVPVQVDNKLVGIVSIGDVVKVRLGELERERSQLESYISGR